MADAYPYYAALAADPNRGVALMVGNAVVGFAAGALAAWKIGGREKRGLEVRGLRYPQGPMYLRAAFKRMGAILGEER
ncbi:MAG: hypothetical protein DRP11_04340 [Candidatus Aenigmatarchaeota archaeon]|nr:MAG: hypothetical protein DRP11_04340 [Candidatus Aenigmarchaeota archaeon]